MLYKVYTLHYIVYKACTRMYHNNIYACAHTYTRVYSTRSLAEERLALFPGALEAAGEDPYEDPAQVQILYTHCMYCPNICVCTVVIICVYVCMR